jgi:hypothetical protein
MGRTGTRGHLTDLIHAACAARPGSRRSGTVARTAAWRLLVTTTIAGSLALPAEALAWQPPDPGPDRGCTIVDPAGRSTLEVTIPDSFEFCPMLARALSEDVLHRRVGITVGHWHYPGAALSCTLRQLAPRQGRRITIRNSHRACRWLIASGWVATRSGQLRTPMG